MAKRQSSKAVGYVRVSRIGGRGGDSFLSPDLQREEIARVAAREGLEVVEVIEELDASGGDSRRPGRNRAIEMVERGQASAIVVWRLSRFSRNVKDALVAMERIEAAGGRVCSATEDPQQRARADAHAGDRRGRTGAGPGRVRRRNGERNRPGRVKGHLHPLTESGVRGLVSNPAYLGQARYGDLVREDAHEAIVPRALWRRCQARARPSAPSGRLTRRYLLQGIATCASCGRVMYLSGGKRHGKDYEHYICRRLECEITPTPVLQSLTPSC